MQTYNRLHDTHLHTLARAHTQHIVLSVHCHCKLVVRWRHEKRRSAKAREMILQVQISAYCLHS